MKPEADAATARRRKLPGVLALAGPVAFAALLIFWKLGSTPIWLDEGYGIEVSRLPWSALIDSLQHQDAVFVLYYGLLHIVGAGYPTLATGRLVSAILALAAIPIVFATGSRIFDKRVGLVASLLVATNFLFLTEARDARMYSLVGTIDAASWLALLTALTKPSLARLALYGSLVTLSLWLHPLAIFNAASQLVAVLLLTRDRRIVFRLLGTLAIATALFIPLVAFAKNPVSWDISWIFDPRAPDLQRAAGYTPWTSGLGPHVVWRTLRDNAGGIVPALIGVTFISGALLVGTLRRNRGVLLLGLWLLGPITFALVFSYVIVPIFVGRYVIEVVPAAALLIAWALFEIPDAAPRLVAGLVLAIGSALSLINYYENPRMDWDKVSATLRSEARPHDRLFLFPTIMLPAYEIAREQDLAGVPPLSVIFPPPHTPVWQSDLRPDPVPIGYAQIWFIGQARFSTPGLTSLTRHYRMVESVAANGLLFQRYVPL